MQIDRRSMDQYQSLSSDDQDLQSATIKKQIAIAVMDIVPFQLPLLDFYRPPLPI